MLRSDFYWPLYTIKSSLKIMFSSSQTLYLQIRIIPLQEQPETVFALTICLILYSLPRTRHKRKMLHVLWICFSQVFLVVCMACTFSPLYSFEGSIFYCFNLVVFLVIITSHFVWVPHYQTYIHYALKDFITILVYYIY